MSEDLNIDQACKNEAEWRKHLSAESRRRDEEIKGMLKDFRSEMNDRMAGLSSKIENVKIEVVNNMEATKKDLNKKIEDNAGNITRMELKLALTALKVSTVVSVLVASMALGAKWVVSKL